jgi:hypothetical protein
MRGIRNYERATSVTQLRFPRHLVVAESGSKLEVGETLLLVKK